MLFNKTRYFRIPLELIGVSLSFNKSLLILISFIIYALKRTRQKVSQNYYIFFIKQKFCNSLLHIINLDVENQYKIS
jgi:hypothetical protein